MKQLRDERGSVLVLAAVSLSAILGTMALALDVGVLFTARGEAQKAADAAALAGAASFIAAPRDGAAAAQAAAEVAGRNLVRNRPVALLPGQDLTVDAERERVTVTVRRLGARGDGVSTFFARMFGVASVDVEASATAEALPVGTAACLTSLAAPDAFRDVNGNGEFDAADQYEAALTGYGTGERNGQPASDGIDPAGATYDRDFGRPIVLTPGSAGEPVAPGTTFAVALPSSGVSGGGAGAAHDPTSRCESGRVQVGDALPTEGDEMAAVTRQGLAELIAQDPGARWAPASNAVAGSRYEPWRASPRVIQIPLFDPSEPPRSRGEEIRVANVSAFWLESVGGEDVVGRFLFASGVAAGRSGGLGDPEVGPALKAVHLIR